MKEPILSTRTKLLSIGAYLGFAPQLHLLNFNNKENNVLQYHIQRSLNLYFLLLPSIVIWIFVQALELVLIINFPNINYSTLYLILVSMDVISGIPLIFCGVLWLISVFQINWGVIKPMNLIAKVSDFRVSKVILVRWGIFLQLIVLFVFLLIMRANQIANQYHENASVYLLYENQYQYPRWLFASGFYPIAEIANIRWGKGSVAVEPLTRENVNKAFREGRFVVLASHGGYQFGSVLLNTNDYYFPTDAIQMGGAGPNLQFVYISGCNTDNLGSEWRQSLSPAEVITFDRISWAAEHAYWLWTGGIKVVLEIK